MNDHVENILDNLDCLETALLQGEQLLRKGSSDPALIHILFRYAHNSKGALAMFGDPDSVRMLHALETRFDHVRTRLYALSAELVDQALKVLSILRDHLTEGKECADEMDLLATEIEQQAARALNGTSAQSTSLPFSLTAPEQSMLQEQRKKGAALYLIEKVLLPSISKADFEGLPIFEDLQAHGIVIACRPSYEQITQAQQEALLQILFASGESKEDLACVIFDPLSQVLEAGAKEQAPTPPAKVSQQIPTRRVHKPSARPKILVVEDEYISRRIAQQNLQRVGELEFASDGREGLLAYLLALEENAPFDLVYLDIQMPILDGRKLLRLIRKAEQERDLGPSELTKVIMLTGLDTSEHILGAFREGCEGYLLKPLNVEKLGQLLTKLGFSPPSTPNQ